MGDIKKIIATSIVHPTKELYKKMYDTIFRKERLINILILFFVFFMFIAVMSSGRGAIVDYIIIFVISVLFVFLFKKKDNKIKKIIDTTPLNNPKSIINFYEDYFEVEHINGDKTVLKKYEYNQIKKVIDDQQHIFITIDNIVEIVNKKDINKECLSKLNKKIILNEEDYKIKMKLNVVLLSNILSTFIALLFIMLCIIFFNIPGFPLGIVEYSWIFFLFIPIPIYLIVLGCKHTKQEFKCFKYIFTGLIIITLFLICGIRTFTKKDNISHSFYSLSQVEKIVNMDFPSDGKISVASQYEDNVKKVIMVKFKNSDKEDVLDIVNGNKWSKILLFPEGYIDNYYLMLIQNSDYFCQYNVSNKSFNSYGKGDKILYMAYNETTNTLFILDYYISR